MPRPDSKFLLICCWIIFEFASWVEGIATWPVWGNQFHLPPPPPPHVDSLPNHQWPPSNNIIPPLFMHPQQEFIYHRLPYPLNDLHSRHQYFPIDSLSDAIPSSLQSNQIPSLNYSASFKVSHPTVRHVDSRNGARDLNLMLYQAHPSYDRINHPPPSILITSRPLSVTTPKNYDYIPGEVKLSSSPAVQFVPHPNVPATGSATGWNTAVTLQVSLRPESWTKSKRPTVTDKMRQFLPELKYYKNGLKAMNPNLVKNTVEKYVLVAKKEGQTDREVVTQPSVTVVANDLIVYPRPSSEEPARDKLPEDDWEEDSNESHFNSHGESPIPVFVASTIHPVFMKYSTNTPSKSIDQIVAEVFATATPNTRGGESDESEATQEEKGLSDLFDMIYVQSNTTHKSILNHTTETWLKMEPKKRTEPNTKKVDIITAPPDVLPLPINGITLGYTSLQEENEPAVNENTTQISFINDTSTTQTPTLDTLAKEDIIPSTEAVTIRCQGMWCHHSTPQSEPLKSQQSISNEIQSINVTNIVDPLLNYLGLAWPQHDTDRQSKSSSLATKLPSSSTTTKIPTTSARDFTVHITAEVATSKMPLSPMRDNDVVDLIPLDSAKRPNYKELRDFGNEISAPPPPATQVSREHLGAMFNALGHGIGQVMSIVMPLAAPKRKDAHSENHHGSIDSMDFDAFS